MIGLWQVLRVEWILLVLAILVFTAPFTWPLYTSSLLIINFLSGTVAHSAFRSVKGTVARDVCKVFLDTRDS